MKELTGKQKAFVAEYMIDLDRVRAYAKVYGVGPSTAKSNSYKLFKQPWIKVELDKQLDARAKRTLVDVDAVILGLLEEAKNTEPGSSHGARVSAWTQLGKYLKMFTEKVEHSGTDGQPIMLQVITGIDRPPGAL